MTTHVNNHPDIETLSAFADAELNEAIAGRVRAHLRDCGDCTRRVEAVRALASAARALPRDIAAPPQAWDALRDRMVRERTTRPAATRGWHNGWMAAAAAIVLVAGAFAIGWVLGGFGEHLRDEMGLATAQRNYGAALVVARTSSSGAV